MFRIVFVILLWFIMYVLVYDMLMACWLFVCIFWWLFCLLLCNSVVIDDYLVIGLVYLIALLACLICIDTCCWFLGLLLCVFVLFLVFVVFDWITGCWLFNDAFCVVRHLSCFVCCFGVDYLFDFICGWLFVLFGLLVFWLCYLFDYV